MLTTTQIILLSVIGVCLMLSVVFMIMFIVEVLKGRKSEEVEVEEQVQSVFEINNYSEVVAEPAKEENSVSDMLASLEEQTKDEEVASPAEEILVEEPVAEEPVTEEVVEEQPVEVQAEEASVENKAEEVEAEDVKEETQTSEEEDSVSAIDSVGHGIVYSGNLNDYKARLESVIEARNKIERDLTKRQKSILKYERTKRRMNRNQKMLDRRAGELTNLNLLMYSVTDIKNIDEDKKAKQEDLTAHIAELKASIQDADEYIESNKGKNENDIKMAKYLLNEKNRYNDEIAELEELIKAIESNNPDAKAE